MVTLERQLGRLRETIGCEYPVQGWNTLVTADSIRHFAHGMGDDNPRWTERRSSEAVSHLLVAPPMYLYSCCSAGRAAEAEPMSPPALLPGTGALWRGDAWTFHGDVLEGQSIRASVVLLEAVPRESRTRGTVVEVAEKFLFRTGPDVLLAEYVKSTMRFPRSPGSSGSASADRDSGRGTTEPDGAETLWSEAELDAIMAESLAEPIRGSRPRRARDLRVGDDLGSVVKGPLTVTGIIAWVLGWGSPLALTDRLANRYWTLSPDSRLTTAAGLPDTPEGGHWNDELAGRVGMARSYDFGSQRISWMSHLLTDWCGDDGRLVSLDGRLLAPNVVGDVTRIRGEVTSVDAEGLVECAVRAVNQHGRTTASARATVRLPW
ncbi:FAS1-like dehydratase domain-containing protein [Rhodococcus koreensis]